MAEKNRNNLIAVPLYLNRHYTSHVQNSTTHFIIIIFDGIVVKRIERSARIGYLPGMSVRNSEFIFRKKRDCFALKTHLDQIELGKMRDLPVFLRQYNTNSISNLRVCGKK